MEQIYPPPVRFDEGRESDLPSQVSLQNDVPLKLLGRQLWRGHSPEEVLLLGWTGVGDRKHLRYLQPLVLGRAKKQ